MPAQFLPARQDTFARDLNQTINNMTQLFLQSAQMREAAKVRQQAQQFQQMQFAATQKQRQQANLQAQQNAAALQTRHDETIGLSRERLVFDQTKPLPAADRKLNLELAAQDKAQTLIQAGKQPPHALLKRANMSGRFVGKGSNRVWVSDNLTADDVAKTGRTVTDPATGAPVPVPPDVDDPQVTRNFLLRQHIANAAIGARKDEAALFQKAADARMLTAESQANAGQTALITSGIKAVRARAAKIQDEALRLESNRAGSASLGLTFLDEQYNADKARLRLQASIMAASIKKGNYIGTKGKPASAAVVAKGVELVKRMYRARELQDDPWTGRQIYDSVVKGKFPDAIQLELQDYLSSQ